MKTSAFLRECGDYVAKHGFTPEWSDKRKPHCGCFWHASAMVAREHGGTEYAYNLPQEWQALKFAADQCLHDVLGMEVLYASYLRKAGWKKGETKDAAAAFYIAADIEAAQGR